MEALKSNNTLEDEQKIIVKFLIVNNHRKGNKIHKQLEKNYGENTVSLNKIEDWIKEFVGLTATTPVKLSEVTDTLLHRTDNPWRPNIIPQVENDKLTTEHILKKVLRILNKVTDENYFILLKQLNSLPIDTEDCLRRVVKEILKYVCEEHKYSYLYAKLCTHIGSRYVPYDQQIIGACQMFLTFKELIRSGCVDELTMKLKETESLDYFNENIIRYKLKGLNIFICELYKANALMIEVIEEEYLQLLVDENLEKNLFQIECFYISLNNLGKFLELQCNETPPKFQKEILDKYFAKLSNILENNSNTKLLPSFLRFNITELIEYRARNWIPRINQLESKDNSDKKTDNDNKKKTRFFKWRKFSQAKRGKAFNTKQQNVDKTKKDWVVIETVKSPLQIKLTNLTEDVKIERNVRSCLNKLTAVNCNKLTEQILALPLETIPERVVTLIVNKSVSEPLFNHMYAELCGKLCKKVLPSTNTEDNIEGSNEIKKTFKELILDECDKIWLLQIDSDDNNDKELRFKKKILKGIVKFLTELYKNEIISSEKLKSYIDSLFDESKQTKSNIELLCNLLTCCGSVIEKNDKEYVENVFKNIRILFEKTPQNPKRIWFMLLDLLEFRGRDWSPRVIPEPVLLLSKNIRHRDQVKRNRSEKKVKNLTVTDGDKKNRNQSKGFRKNFKSGLKKTVQSENKNNTKLKTNDNQSSNESSNLNNDVPHSNAASSLAVAVSGSTETNNA